MLFDADKIQVLGDLASVFRRLKSRGWTKASVLYVVDRVWWEEAEIDLGEPEPEQNFWDDRTTPRAYSEQDSERDMKTIRDRRERLQRVLSIGSVYVSDMQAAQLDVIIDEIASRVNADGKR